MEENKEDNKIKYTDDELKDRAADVEIFYKKWGKDAIEFFIEEEKDHLADNAQNLEDLFASRGIIKGLKRFKKWMEDNTNQSLSRHDKPEEEPELGREFE